MKTNLSQFSPHIYFGPSHGEPQFMAPGPGSWQREAVHLPLPLTRYSDYMLRSFARGLHDGFENYGILLDWIEPALVNGLAYMRAHPCGAPENATTPPPKLVFQLLTRLHPQMRRRIKSSKLAMEQKIWREEVRLWDEKVKPASIKAHLALQAIDPFSLNTPELINHLDECYDHCERMAYQHFRYTVTALVPVGDFLWHTAQWTKKPAAQLMALLRGSSPISMGVAADELNALADAIRTDSDWAVQFMDVAAFSWSDAYQAILSGPLPIKSAMQDYLQVVGFRIVDGYDISGHYALEMPELLIKTILALINDKHALTQQPIDLSAVNEIRNLISIDKRSQFDSLFEEASLVNRLREERGSYSDAWATGLARRAVLAAGSRLVARGQLEHPDLLVEASHAEIKSLLDGGDSPTNQELSERAAFRHKMIRYPAPLYLGTPPQSPPPTEWLPKAAHRMAQAFDAAFGFVLGIENTRLVDGDDTIIIGLSVSLGSVEGIARVVESPADFKKLQQDDILVTKSTTPYFNVILPLLKGVVTDRGGILSHAAIVAREYGIAGVVGTYNATSLIRDGMRIRIDGTTGEVKILS